MPSSRIELADEPAGARANGQPGEVRRQVGEVEGPLRHEELGELEGEAAEHRDCHHDQGEPAPRHTDQRQRDRAGMGDEVEGLVDVDIEAGNPGRRRRAGGADVHHEQRRQYGEPQHHEQAP